MIKKKFNEQIAQQNAQDGSYLLDSLSTLFPLFWTKNFPIFILFLSSFLCFFPFLLLSSFPIFSFSSNFNPNLIKTKSCFFSLSTVLSSVKSFISKYLACSVSYLYTFMNVIDPWTVFAIDRWEKFWYDEVNCVNFPQMKPGFRWFPAINLSLKAE